MFIFIKYELFQNELKPILRRTADAIFNRGGVIRKIENLGTKETPFRISANGVVYKNASYFLYEFHIPPSTLYDFKDELHRDVDIVKQSIYKKNEPTDFECTLHEELLPPPYRKDVQELLELAKRKHKPKFSYNTGLDHYPFQK